MPVFSNQIGREMSARFPRVIVDGVALPPHSEQRASQLLDRTFKTVKQLGKARTNAGVSASRRGKPVEYDFVADPRCIAEAPVH